MKTTQILYLLLFVIIVISVVTSTHLLDGIKKEGYEASLPVNRYSEPAIPKGVMPVRLNIQAQPNVSKPGDLPFGPYAQTASVGSYQYQDPAQLPAELKQMTQLYEDLRSFLVFEGPSISDSSDPSVQLPLTQLRSDSRALQQEISVLSNNAGVQSSLTQQSLADIQEALTFLQRKVRLFQSSGVISDEVEGFKSGSSNVVKTRATKADLQKLQTRVYAAILTLSASGTKDPVVQARVKKLQDMYSAVVDMVSKLSKGIWTSKDVPVFKEDIAIILPNLSNPKSKLADLFTKGSGKGPSPLEKQVASLVGEEYAKSVLKSFQENGTMRLNFELDYRGPGTATSGATGSGTGVKPMKYTDTIDLIANTAGPNVDPNAMYTAAPFDSTLQGAHSRNEETQKKLKVGKFDWEQRASSICEQVRLRGFNPLDFGCIAKGSMMSPAYSWRGHTKMICGRLAATTDSGLPMASGCPSPDWKGWTI
jgi:hypothetical protein